MVKKAWLKWSLLVALAILFVSLIPVLLFDRSFGSPYGVAVLDFLFFIAAFVLLGGLIIVTFEFLYIPMGLIGGTLLCFSGFGLIVFQVYGFLRYGEGQYFWLRDALEAIGFDLTGLDYPRDWVGLKRVLKFAVDWIPSALFLLIVGIPIGARMIYAVEISKGNLPKKYKKLLQLP